MAPHSASTAMTSSTHFAHGLAGDHTAPDWPALTHAEVAALLRDYPQVGEPLAIPWHSPRPLSAACLVRAGQQTLDRKSVV